MMYVSYGRIIIHQVREYSLMLNLDETTDQRLAAINKSKHLVTLLLLIPMIVDRRWSDSDSDSGDVPQVDEQGQLHELHQLVPFHLIPIHQNKHSINIKE
jgi:hypothetical protein